MVINVESEEANKFNMDKALSCLQMLKTHDIIYNELKLKYYCIGTFV